MRDWDEINRKTFIVVAIIFILTALLLLIARELDWI